jgi:carbamoyltransferase
MVPAPAIKSDILADIHFPHSLGLLYSAITYYTGFKVNSGEYKVMGLAPYGEAVYKDRIMNELMDIKEDGSFRMNMEYFNYAAGLTMTNENSISYLAVLQEFPKQSLHKKKWTLHVLYRK